MKNYMAIFALLLLAIGILSCSQNKFDKVEKTVDAHYSIVYKDGKCGVYDNTADSLVTSIKYDVLEYGHFTVEDSIEVTVWRCECDGQKGLLSIAGKNNELLEFLFFEN